MPSGRTIHSPCTAGTKLLSGDKVTTNKVQDKMYSSIFAQTRQQQFFFHVSEHRDGHPGHTVRGIRKPIMTAYDKSKNKPFYFPQQPYYINFASDL